jgi:hypothetical protein
MTHNYVLKQADQSKESFTLFYVKMVSLSGLVNRWEACPWEMSIVPAMTWISNHPCQQLKQIDTKDPHRDYKAVKKSKFITVRSEKTDIISLNSVRSTNCDKLHWRETHQKLAGGRCNLHCVGILKWTHQSSITQWFYDIRKTLNPKT